jgi:serine/threonine protein kinase
VLTVKDFARKLVRVHSKSMETDLHAGISAITNLNRDGKHPHIVATFDHGYLLSNPSFYFIDMELCLLNLRDYISGPRPLLESPGGAFVIETAEPQARIRNVWVIMLHIARGLDFIHQHQQVHRDLKPQNSEPP